MEPTAHRSRVSGPGKPRLACRHCGLWIPLDAIVVDGPRRMLACVRCHGTDTWELDLPS